MRFFLLLFAVLLVPLDSYAISWNRVAQCLPDMREEPIVLTCTGSGGVTEVPAERYALVVLDGTAYIKQDSNTCNTGGTGWAPGTQVAVDESKGSNWCCRTEDGATAQLVRCK